MPYPPAAGPEAFRAPVRANPDQPGGDVVGVGVGDGVGVVRRVEPGVLDADDAVETAVDDEFAVVPVVPVAVADPLAEASEVAVPASDSDASVEVPGTLPDSVAGDVVASVASVGLGSVVVSTVGDATVVGAGTVAGGGFAAAGSGGSAGRVATWLAACCAAGAPACPAA